MLGISGFLINLALALRKTSTKEGLAMLRAPSISTHLLALFPDWSSNTINGISDKARMLPWGQWDILGHLAISTRPHSRKPDPPGGVGHCGAFVESLALAAPALAEIRVR
jgi:hypothetical protein